MALLRVISITEPDFSDRWAEFRAKLSLEATLLGNTDRIAQVRSIISQVRQEGDAAVAKLTAAYDQVELTPSQFRVPKDQLEQAFKQMDATLLGALRESIDNVRRYQQAIKTKPEQVWESNGVRLGVRYTPLKRVGVCVPGASAPLVSTVIMTVVPAQVAGVEQIAVISPPRYQGSIHPAILGLCYELKIDEVYRVSGAQAVAALAMGTPAMPKVDKIVGPSSDWAQLAKKELFGLIDIDSFAGPSDVLIVADDSANAAWAAADLLSQAEHAPGAAVLITDSEKLAAVVAEQVDLQLDTLSRSGQTREMVKANCLAVVAGTMDRAIAMANEFAPEHLQVQCRDSDAVAKRITHAGAIFIGANTPVAVGDYYAGPSHTLPTGGTARMFGPLNVNDFLKQSSIVSYSAEALQKAGGAIDTIASAEGLDAHANSVRIRKDEG